MIENHLIDRICCFDQSVDTLGLTESVCFNTMVLDLRAENDNRVTYVIINQGTAQKLSESLKKWVEGGNNENS